MSLQLRSINPVPEQTRRVALATFPKGNPYITLRERLGPVFENEDFAEMYPATGQPCLAPWRLALVTILQFREDLSDRQAAEAVRSRIDWKYLLGLELDDSGFSHSVLSDFRNRLVVHHSEQLLLNKLLERCRELNLIKVRGQQRTDSTYILGAVRVLTRLEQIGESVRAVLNEIATLEPDWLQAWAPREWYERYGHRVEEKRLPESKTEKQQYALMVGQDGLMILEQIEQSETHRWLVNLSRVRHLRTVLDRHYDYSSPALRFKDNQEIAHLTPDAESPYDQEVRFRRRQEITWVGYQGNLTETCDDDYPHLITCATTTLANAHEAEQLPLIHQQLADSDLLPHQHFADSAYISAEVMLNAAQDHHIQVIGPPRQDVSWQAQTEDAYDLDVFVIDWQNQRVQCPQGHFSAHWYPIDENGTNRSPGIKVRFRKQDCLPCPARSLCTHSKGERQLRLPTEALYQAVTFMRSYITSEEGKVIYHKRAGIEGTISQAVRICGFRQTRYIGLAKTHLQHVISAASMNFSRLADWFHGVPRRSKRISRFAQLAPLPL